MNTVTSVDVGSPPPDLFVTRAALQRRKLAPNLHAEAAAFCELSKVLADDPSLAVRHLVEIARHLCDAGSAGLSLLRHTPAGEPIVHWEAISGALTGYEGTDTPQACSPCGLCLDTGITILVSRPQRAFNCLHDVQPSIVEDLIVPLYDSMRKPLGTLWIVHHDSTSRFCSDDARIVEQLAAQLVLALRLLDHASEHRHALAELESLQMAQQSLLTYDQDQEQRRRERAENESRQALVFKDAMIDEVNHRTKNTLQMAASLLSLHARVTASAQTREALLESCGRLQLLAKVHELLHVDPDCAQSIFMPRLLQTFGDALRQSFGSASAQVRLEISSDPITLSAADAIAIVLLANEAVTNAYRHAFPNDSTGEITVNLQSTPEKAMILRITDTGIGLQLPSGADGMGLRLIRIFAAQLRGELDIARKAGATGTQITLRVDRPAD